MKTFFKTVATVTLFSVCEKFLGFTYRIYLSRAIGAEGIGIYQVALSVFALLLTVCCSGTPITVSRLMTKYKAEGDLKRRNEVISAGLFSALAFSLPVCVLFFIFKNRLGIIFSDLRCVAVFLAVLPGLVFNSLYSVLRGVFWGEKDFLPYSVIELLEEICMIIAGVLIISRADSVADGANGAGFAVLISYLFSFSVATIAFFMRKNRLTNPFPELKPLLASATPVTAMRTTNSLAISLVSVILPARLISAGYTSSQAMSLFGAAAGQAIPILFIPTTLIGSFALVLVPEISESYYKKNWASLKTDTEKAVKFTAFLSCATIPIFITNGEEIGILIFNSPSCGEYLAASSFLMLFMGLSSITTSILNSIGLEKQTLLYYIISGTFMLACVIILPKFLGIYALLAGFSFVYVLTTILNFLLLKKHCPLKLKYKRFIAYSAAFTLPTVLLGLMLDKLLLPVLGTFTTFLLCAAVQTAFISALFFGFGLVDVTFVKEKFKLKKNKKVARENA